MDLKALLSDLPPTIQYIAVIGLVMLILYVCLTLTRLFGAKRGEKYDYNDPEKADELVPDLFASTAFKRKKKADKDAATKDSKESGGAAANGDSEKD